MPHFPIFLVFSSLFLSLADISFVVKFQEYNFPLFLVFLLSNLYNLIKKKSRSSAWKIRFKMKKSMLKQKGN